MPFKLIFLSLLLWCQAALSAPEVLPPEQVFQVSATALNTEQIEITWHIRRVLHSLQLPTRVPHHPTPRL